MSHFEWMLLGFILFLLLNAVDYFLTSKILKHPTGKEHNPVMRWMYTKFGMQGMLYVKVLILGLLGIQLFSGNLDLFTIWYLDFMFVVVLALMYRDGVQAGIKFIPAKNR